MKSFSSSNCAGCTVVNQSHAKDMILADHLEIRQAGNPDQTSAILDKNVVVHVEYEIIALVGSGRVAGHV